MDLQCRDCGEWWVATEYPETWGDSGGEPACIHPGECPKCDGHDTECDCEDCSKPPAKRGMAWVNWKRGQKEGK